MESEFLLIGATGAYAGPLPEIYEDVRWSESHVALSVRAQVGLVRVEFWSDVEVRAAGVLFEGEIDLPDARLCVADLDDMVRYVRRFGIRGRQPVTIAVDERQTISRIYVIGANADIASHEGFEGPWFGAVAPSARHPSRPELIEYYLSDHDSPEGRLSAVIQVISANVGQSRLGRDHEMMVLREWLRWLAVGLRTDACVRAVERIREFVSTPADSETAAEFAATIVSELVGATER